MRKLVKKEHYILKNKSIKWLALAGSVISFCEDLMEIFNTNSYYVEESFYSYHNWDEEEKVRIYLPKELERNNMPKRDSIETIFSDAPMVSSVFWKSLYRRALEVFIENIIPLLKDKAKLSDTKHVEYMLLITPKKIGVILEGDVDKVRIPYIKTYVMAHTHPSPNCFFSQKDIISSLDLFANQGLLSAVITTTCSAIMYRVDDMTVEDYERLIIIGNMVKKGKLHSVLEEFSKLHSIKLMVIGVGSFPS